MTEWQQVRDEWTAICGMVQAQSDYLCDVPGAHERYQYWSAELERLRAHGGQALVK